MLVKRISISVSQLLFIAIEHGLDFAQATLIFGHLAVVQQLLDVFETCLSGLTLSHQGLLINRRHQTLEAHPGGHRPVQQVLGDFDLAAQKRGRLLV